MWARQFIPFIFGCFFFTTFLVLAINSSTNNPHLLALFATLLVLLLLGLKANLKSLDQKHFRLSEKITCISSTVVGGGVTFLLIQTGITPPVIAAAGVGVAGYLISLIYTKNYHFDVAPTLYCGAFIGMVSSSLLNELGVATASTIAGILFLFLCDRFNGCGGKLGSIAFMACAMTLVLVHLWRLV